MSVTYYKEIIFETTLPECRPPKCAACNDEGQVGRIGGETFPYSYWAGSLAERMVIVRAERCFKCCGRTRKK